MCTMHRTVPIDYDRYEDNGGYEFALQRRPFQLWNRANYLERSMTKNRSNFVTLKIYPFPSSSIVFVSLSFTSHIANRFEVNYI